MKSESPLDIVYLRVSKKGEKMQDLDHQGDAVIERFELKTPLILKEKGSAYKLDNIKNRAEFLKILDICFNAKEMTIEDLFLQKYKKQKIRIFIWDLNRIMRNLKFNMLFSVLSIIHDVRVYSFSDKEINDKPLDTDTEFMNLLFAMLGAKKAQDYSDDISKNIKKAFKKDRGVSVSRKGHKLGNKFRDLEGNPVDLPVDAVVELKTQIKNHILYYESKGYKSYAGKIVEKIKKDFGIMITRRYVSKIKNGSSR